ncbi:TetR-like C-terminal domain-containing protein [Mycolicibacterium sp. ND9-15]|uniref:TetR-like C-terminal domain-containing protein n=1 Tax=Mycolicibacterium sp. ND9-15 TaxID=3042320 RepID=UPI002DD8F4C9|nr:TetR-like C-terminal domain-containing protein [Mycolicibacterium sp. ND9-15]WSE58700.1 TetR-like C-terminal domain-containing protein [Mycolicibacterium sp. ND9-15]
MVARNNLWRGRFTGSAQVVLRAVERGGLPVGTDPDELIEFLVAPAHLRLLLLDRPIDDALLGLSVRNTIAAYAVGRQNP